MNALKNFINNNFKYIIIVFILFCGYQFYESWRISRDAESTDIRNIIADIDSAKQKERDVGREVKRGIESVEARCEVLDNYNTELTDNLRRERQILEELHRHFIKKAGNTEKENQSK